MAKKDASTRKPNLVDKQIYASIIEDLAAELRDFRITHHKVLDEYFKLEKDLERALDLPVDKNGMRDWPNDIEY